MTNCTSPIYIESLPALENFCSSANEESAIGLDTEFVRERTYYPIFALLQISAGNRVAIIDPLTIESLAPLRSILLNPRIQKILHSGRQDLEVLLHATGVLPINVIDTQVAAGLSGLSDQIGYGTLVNNLLSIQLNKEHTRTDWLQRPLSPDQLQYASDDVAYLPAITTILLERLTKLGRLDWLIADSNTLLDPAIYANTPDLAWHRLAGNTDLPYPLLNRLKALSSWREGLAQRLDLPRSWILRDNDIHTLSRSSQLESITLPRIRGLSREEHDRLHLEVTSMLHSLPLDSELKEKPFQPDTERKILLKKLSQIVRVAAEDLKISPTILASRRDLELLIDNPDASRITQGWRLNIIGRQLLSQLNQSSSHFAHDRQEKLPSTH